MSICDFAGIFSILLRYVTGLGKDELYSKIFMSYYEYEGDPSVLTAYTANKVVKGQKYLDRSGKKFYAEADNYTVLYDDLDERVLPFVSDKFGMCAEIKSLIISDGMNEADRDNLLKSYPNSQDEITDFLTKVIIFSLNRPTRAGAASPIMEERINIPAISNCKYFCGREKELQTFSEMLEAHDRIFIQGVGGIGKSEFVKKFIKDNKPNFTNILFLTFSDNLKNTIAAIPFKNDDKEKKIGELYSAHMDYLRFMKNDTLIVIDNFDILPETDNDLDDILELNCKIIFTTRNNFGDDYEIFKISEIDKSALLEIAEKLKVTDVDRETLDRIFEAVHNHTLACELILRLLKKSTFTPDELLDKIINEHVGLDVSDKIRKDISATYYEHIHQLFRLFALTNEQQETMRLLSLLPVEGIDDKYFKNLTGVKDMNIINELDEIGLVYHDEHIIRVHPLVGEAAAADFIPDMDNCREFTDNLILECRHHLPDEMNVMRQAVVLEICDRIVEFSAKNDIDRYFYFLVNAYPYAETFEDEDRMKLYLAEMEKYHTEVKDRFLRAVYFMSRASFAMLFESDCAAALKHTISAQRSIPEVVGGGFYSRQEIDICFNVNNNLGRFYLENGDLRNSKKYLKKAMDILKSCYKDGLPEDSMALYINLRKLEEAEVNNQLLLELNGE